MTAEIVFIFHKLFLYFTNYVQPVMKKNRKFGTVNHLQIDAANCFLFILTPIFSSICMVCRSRFLLMAMRRFR